MLFPILLQSPSLECNPLNFMQHAYTFRYAQLHACAHIHTRMNNYTSDTHALSRTVSENKELKKKKTVWL